MKSENRKGPEIYCAGCNERFQVGTNAGVCPRCGAGIADIAPAWLHETLLCREPSTDLVNVPQDELTIELDELVGNNVGVYECKTLVGAGGMGRVYLARHSKLGRHCALKILSPRVAKQEVDYVARFLNEGRSTAQLVHPNIVTVHNIGEADGYHFLEMEFVSGRSLQELLNDEGRLTPLRATVLMCGIAEGLSAAHRNGILHRDLKPDNVLLSKRGIAKLADFGLAKRILNENTNECLVGTPNFMAPELLNGERATTASDVYALGVCYYLLLTGQIPFVGDSLQELRRVVNGDATPDVRATCGDISLEMAECLSLMMAKAPQNRPRDGIEAAQLLHAIAGQIRDIESLLSEAFRDNDSVSWTRDGDQYRLALTLPDGRRQTVFVEPSDHSASQRLLLIYSMCCLARSDFYEDALRINAEVSHGGLSIRKIDGEDHFVMVDTYPRGTVDVDEIRRSVIEVGFRADEVEHRLTGLDHH